MTTSRFNCHWEPVFLLCCSLTELNIQTLRCPLSRPGSPRRNPNGRLNGPTLCGTLRIWHADKRSGEVVFLLKIKQGQRLDLGADTGGGRQKGSEVIEVRRRLPQYRSILGARHQTAEFGKGPGLTIDLRPWVELDVCEGIEFNILINPLRVIDETADVQPIIEGAAGYQGVPCAFQFKANDILILKRPDKSFGRARRLGPEIGEGATAVLKDLRTLVDAFERIGAFFEIDLETESAESPPDLFFRL